MKKILIIALACTLTLSSFLFTACDERTDTSKESEQTTQAETKAEESNPVPVKSANGKNGRQLLEDAIANYTTASSFDLSMTMETTEEGAKTVQKVEMKINESSMYMNMDLEDQKMKMWFVDDVLYMEMDDEKYKMSGASVEDIFGENFVEGILSELPSNESDTPDAYLKKLETAQIYSYKGIYYFSITVTEAEAIEMELHDKEYTETMYFDSTGALKKIVAKDAEETITMVLNSYGKEVKINKPANADSFIEQSFGPSEDLPPDDSSDSDHGSQVPATYAVYEELLDKIENATSYVMRIDINGEQYLSYQIDSKGGKFVYGTDSENSTYEMWIVDGQGYVSINDEEPIKSEITATMLQSFESVASLKDYLVQRKVLGDDMVELSISDTTYPGEKTLTFSVKNSYSEDFYSFTFGDSYIDALIITTSNGQSEYINYIFDFTNTEVYAPI